MSEQNHVEHVADLTERRPDPVVRAVSLSDIVESFAAGLRDFQAAPLFGLFFGAVFAAGGLLIIGSAAGLGATYLAYPLAAGFTLIGPFAAAGLYEVSRRRELSLPLAWRDVLGVVADQAHRQLGWMAFVTLFAFIVWMYQVRLLIALFLGLRSFTSLKEFLMVVISTPDGLMFLLVGHIIGAILALGLFAITVVSFPLLLERDLDFVTAMITSVRAVAASPGPMVGWAIIITGLLVIAALPLFLGFLVILPVLGHATWHLYRRAVEPPSTGAGATQA